MEPLPRRRSLRLQSYDYAQAGAYFVTVCTQGKARLFGEIVDGEVRLNEAGRMVDGWWQKTPSKFPAVRIDRYVIMPDHFHGIVVIVGAAPCGRPKPAPDHCGRPRGGAPTLGEIIGWFKTMTTNEYIRHVKTDAWPPFPGRLWQRNYYEHVVRNDADLDDTRRYTDNNPLRWVMDTDH